MRQTHKNERMPRHKKLNMCVINRKEHKQRKRINFRVCLSQTSTKEIDDYRLTPKKQKTMMSLRRRRVRFTLVNKKIEFKFELN